MKVSSGHNVPMDINVVIEIPAYSSPVKYEVDKDSGVLMVDRFMGTAMQYPTNYGYVPQSLSGDGDPVDVLVITPDPVLSGCVVRCRPIGLLRMDDEAGEDNKVLAVPISQLTPSYNQVFNYKDISQDKLDRIAHFFEHYKDLEPGKWVTVKGWYGLEDAKTEITLGVERYRINCKEEPVF